nr:hypothetical protein [Tanacetum cinerariifolium]
MVERDDEIKVLGKINPELQYGTYKVLGEVNVELESSSKKLREKLSQEEDTEEEVFEEFSLTLDNVLEKLLDDFMVVLSQNNVHKEVAEEIIKMANDHAEELSSDQVVTDNYLDDEHVEERRPSKRIRVTQEEMVNDKNPKKGR